MSKTSEVYFNAQVLGDGLNPFNIVPSFLSNTNSPAVHSVVALTNGTTTITVAANTKLAILVPISGAVASKTVKGTTSDTGISLSTNQPSIFALSTTQTALYVTSTTSEDLDVYFI